MKMRVAAARDVDHPVGGERGNDGVADGIERGLLLRDDAIEDADDLVAVGLAEGGHRVSWSRSLWRL